MRARTVLVAAVVASLLGAGASVLMHRRATAPPATTPASAVAAPAPVAVGDALPPIVLPGLDGRSAPLAAIAPGRPLLVNFWASWCRPCIEEMPLLDRFAAAQAPAGIAVVGIALDEPAAVRAFLARTPVRYPILLDEVGPQDTSVRLGNGRSVLPYTVLIGADGRVLEQFVGPLKPEHLDAFAKRAAAPTRD